MTILALDAALGGFSVALDRDGALTWDASGMPDALERGLGRVDALLRAAGLRVGDVDRIAVGLGPGSFTGTRIAVSFAKALAQAANRPLVGVSSYDALEPADAPLPRVTFVRGRAGVVCARLATASGMQGACGRIAEVFERLGIGSLDAPLAIAGNTEDVRSEIAERALTVRALPPRAEVPAVAIALLARTFAPAPSPHALAPDYGEAPAVTEAKRP